MWAGCLFGAGLIVAGLGWIGLRELDGSHESGDWIISTLGLLVLLLSVCLGFAVRRRRRQTGQ
ncbi:MAG: LPXTG cell wall anchor domain-containing protein [Planctomycetota bacterium]